MKKITEKELENLQSLVNTINEGQATIGGLELQKQTLIEEVGGLIKQLKKEQAKMEKKYGDITVNLTTGAITDAHNS